jgi:hypothetical protein
MSVYLGETGNIEIRRTTAGEGFMRSFLDPADVNVARRRFSFDFPVDALITGDRIQIRTVDGSNLQLVSGWNFPDGLWYCNVDAAGGIRLYDTFLESINGGLDNALVLVTPNNTQEIQVQVRDSRYRFYGQIRNWEITTSRTSIDVTTLGEEFVEQYNRGLVSGQGRVTCIWDYKVSSLDPIKGPIPAEEPNYLCELILRLKQGATFQGRFFIFTGQPAVWYEADCIVTNTALAFAPGEVVENTIEFLTTGPVQLSTGSTPDLLLQESEDLLLQESDDSILLEDPT